MRNRLLWITLLGVTGITVAAVWIIWAFFLAPLDRAVATANVLRTAFQTSVDFTPRIAVNNAIVFAQNTPTLELITMERSALVRHRLTETWLGSTKEFEIESTFTAKAGFPLREAFVLDVRRGGKVVDVTLPRTRILSLSNDDIRILKDEDGLWNKITAKDRERALRSLQRQARKQFEGTDLVPEAERIGREQMAGIIRNAGYEPFFSGVPEVKN